VSLIWQEIVETNAQMKHSQSSSGTPPRASMQWAFGEGCMHKELTGVLNLMKRIACKRRAAFTCIKPHAHSSRCGMPRTRRRRQRSHVRVKTQLVVRRRDFRKSVGRHCKRSQCKQKDLAGTSWRRLETTCDHERIAGQTDCRWIY